MHKKYFIMTIIISMVVYISATVQASGPIEYTKEIAPDIYSFGSSSGYHSMFFVTDDGVAVFETVNSTHAKKLVKAIRAVTDKPIKYAFHSHNHWDHASGGKVFQDVGAKTVMHKLGAEWLAAHPGTDTSTPNIVWNGRLKKFKIGSHEIEAHYLGLNHGLGMAVFVLPKQRVAYIADLVTPNRVMFSVVPDFNIGEWERSIGELLKLNFDKAVCSHNELPSETVANGCNKGHAKEGLQFISDLRNAIFAEFKKGTPGGKIPGSIKLPQYSHWAYYDDWLEMNAWRIMLDIGMGPFPWFPDQSHR